MIKDENVEFKQELKTIKRLRKQAYQIDMPLIITLVLGVCSSWLIPFMAPIFGLIAFSLFYKKLLYASHYPCPRCKSAFGSAGIIVFGVGEMSCQNCSLDLE